MPACISAPTARSARAHAPISDATSVRTGECNRRELMEPLQIRPGGLVVGAQIVLTSESTGIKVGVLSDGERVSTGSTMFDPPSIASLWRKPDFRKFQVEGVRIRVNQTLTEDFALTIGQVADTIEIRAEAELVQRSTSEIGRCDRHQTGSGVAFEWP